MRREMARDVETFPRELTCLYACVRACLPRIRGFRPARRGRGKLACHNVEINAVPLLVLGT